MQSTAAEASLEAEESERMVLLMGMELNFSSDD